MAEPATDGVPWAASLTWLLAVAWLAAATQRLAAALAATVLFSVRVSPSGQDTIFPRVFVRP